MHSLRLLLAVLVLVCLSRAGSAQQINREVQNVGPGDPAEGDRKPRKELSAEERKTAAALLKTSDAESRALPADLRAYALMQVARGYSQVDPSKAPAILGDAFLATTAMSSDDAFTKQSLQRDILFQLLALDHAKATELLPQAEEQPRDEVSREIVRRAIRAKKLDEAADLIEQIARTSEFPYAEGSELMAAFPKEESWRRGAVFSQALASYGGHEHKKMMFGGGFPEMIAANWRDLAQEQVEQGVDEVLKEAKANDQSATVSLSSNKGDQATFGSMYEFRLFQLLPILSQINKGKADEVLRDQAAVKGLLAKYPNGQESLAPQQPPAGGNNRERSGGSMMLNMRDKGQGQQPGTGTRPPAMDEMQAWQVQADRIVASAGQDAKQALAQAQTLPLKMKGPGGDRPVRADALRGIANSTIKSNPTVAKQAIADMVKASQDLDARAQSQELVEAAKLDLKLGEEEDAKKALETAGSRANDSIKSDQNADDPNRALKAYWPSAAAWQSILRTASRISPALAQKMTADIADDEIRVLAKIALADELAGAPAGRVIVSENREKSKQRFTMMSDQSDDDD